MIDRIDIHSVSEQTLRSRVFILQAQPGEHVALPAEFLRTGFSWPHLWGIPASRVA